MAALPAEKRRWSREEFLAFERKSETKHEFAAGEIFAMAGTSREHNLICVNLAGELRAALRNRPCETYAGDMRLAMPLSDKYVYPDVTVVCDEPVFEDGELDTLVNPAVVIEVLSSSTEAYDRGQKAEAYRSIASLRAYVLVDSQRAHVECFTRESDGWKLRDVAVGSPLVIDALGVSVAWEELYLKVTFAEPAVASESP